MYAPLKIWPFPLWPLLARNGKQYCDTSWKVWTQVASCSHRPPCCHKRYLLIHRSESQTCAACRAMSMISPLNSSSQWTMIQTLMPQLRSAYCWTILLALCCKKIVFRYEIVWSQCHQHNLRQQKNASTWICLLELVYSLGMSPRNSYKTHSSHTAGTCFHWW